MDGWGRKPVLAFCQILAGVTCISAGFAEEDWLILTLNLLGKLSCLFLLTYYHSNFGMTNIVLSLLIAFLESLLC